MTDTQLEDIDNEILEHENAIQHLKTRRNSLIPICKLPAELLCEIFLFAFHDAHYMGKHVSMVCGIWRSTALSCPALWNKLYFGYSGSPSWMNEMLKRSMDAPLTVNVHDQYKPKNRWMNAISAALESIPRITELTLTGIRPEIMPKFLDLMQTRPAKLLRQLSLKSDTMVVFPRNLFSGYAPVLKRFDTVCCFLVDWTAPWLHNVEELLVSMQDRESTPFSDVGNLLEALNTMTSLKKLTLRYVLGPAIDHTIHLPHLTALLLSGRLTHIAVFLRRLHIPSSVEHIDIDVEWITNDSTLDDLANLLAAFNECSYQSGKILARPFHKLSFTMKYNLPFSCSFTFWTDPNASDDHSIHLRLERHELHNPPPLRTYIAVERTFLSFLVANTPLSELRSLDIEMIDDEESAEYQILLLASCRNVEHLTVIGKHPHLLLKYLGLTTTDGGDGLVPTLLPHLRTLSLYDLYFGFAEPMDALVHALEMRKGHNAKIQTLEIYRACGLSKLVDAEALLGELVDTLTCAFVDVHKHKHKYEDEDEDETSDDDGSDGAVM